jgi:hypothetical protein
VREKETEQTMVYSIYTVYTTRSSSGKGTGKPIVAVCGNFLFLMEMFVSVVVVATLILGRQNPSSC